MLRIRSLLSITTLVLGFGPSMVRADLDKLDPLARIAYDRLRAVTPIERMVQEQRSVNPGGELDVFIRGEVSRAALEAAGARVRTSVAGISTAFLPLGAVEAVSNLPGVR